MCRRFSSQVDSPLLSQCLNSYIQHGGKRIRPQLVIWGYSHATGIGEGSGEVPPCVSDVAAAWELFHAFLLIHDDIIDGSDRRRNQPSLHRQLQSLDSDSPRFGTNLGIVAGDLFYAWANQLLSDLDVPADVFRQMHRLFARVATTTGLGQAVDVLQSHAPLAERDEATLLREYSWKTAAYTFEGPLLSAAVLAGLPLPMHAVISRYALALGQAYQMQNDLLDLVRPVAEGSDLVEGKHTFTLLKARQFLDGDARATFDRDLDEIVACNGRAIGLAESVRCRLLATPAIACTATRINELLDGCMTDTAVLPPSLRDAMADCLDRLRAGYFAMPV
ncbi:MAG: polyprenyl synthetase [Phycisphaerales bacterium]|nr:polyprenyl synthetase [Phycisphaerales bacterium]